MTELHSASNANDVSRDLESSGTLGSSQREKPVERTTLVRQSMA